jgi:cytochrome P450
MRPQTKIDPYPLYADFRRCPLIRSEFGPWMTANYAAAESILRDRRFSPFPGTRTVTNRALTRSAIPAWSSPAADLATMDPPDHTRVRRLVSGAFSPKAIAGLEPWIREVTGRLLAAADGAAGFDLIEALAFPLPVAVICHLLGVPAHDQASFRAWGRAVAATLEPQASPDAERQSSAAGLALTSYLRDLVARHRADPDESLLSALVAIEEEGDRLSFDELVSTALLLFVAGFETTVNLIGNGTVALLGEPADWQRLREDPALVPAAVEEMLRYDSPIQVTSRTATEDVDLDGAAMPKGTSVIVAIGGANRDPRVFDQPDRLIVDRPNASRHLAFSRGIHHCLGGALARLEGRIAVEEITRRYPGLELAGPPVRRPMLILRGFESVPVRAAAHPA